MQENCHDIPELAEDNSHLSIAERRQRRPRRMPKRYQDLMPEPEPSLPPLSATFTSASTSPLPSTNLAPHLTGNDIADSTNTNTYTSPPQTSQEIRTLKNAFGLVRKYVTKQLPIFNPDEYTTSADSASKSSVTPLHNNHSFLPYPNENSFRLGLWYWNGGAQKSQESFKQLLNIVGDPSFNSSDVRNTNWNKIDATLASDTLDEIEQPEGEWEDVDAGWRKKSIKILVPFHRRTENPGTREYFGAEIYHRSLVDIIKEKVTDSHNALRMHLDPYELLWEPTSLRKEVRVYGELYTSKAFLNAHKKLQDSPREFGCDLPRVVIGLMFASDATHLTSFGQSKLWPCYLYVGNESKY